ncbi:hypothetical protein F4803DRAFT_384868 [Xylaria telfairii]|nr:hypothetical protein F4803DRAFT_384868 [Xylaria telfairii]
MQTRQTIAVALMAFASIANCQMTPLDDTECSQPAATSSISDPSSSAVVSTSTSPSSSSVVASSTPTGSAVPILTFSYTVSSASASSAAGETTSAAVTTSSSSSAAATPTSTTEATTSSSNPAPSATPSGGSPSSGSGLSGSCSPDGMFNCVAGTQFQQCANGEWSLLTRLAGTKCTEGQSMNLWRRDEDDSEKRTLRGRYKSHRKGGGHNHHMIGW